jgi:hypothetical protein
MTIFQLRSEAICDRVCGKRPRESAIAAIAVQALRRFEGGPST